MKYKLCTNGRAVLLTREIVMLEEDLTVEVEGENEGYTVVFKSGKQVLYRPLVNGVATLKKKFVSPGVVIVIIIKDDEAKCNWYGDSLYAAVKDDSVAVGGNTLEYDKILCDLRLETEDFRVKMANQERELSELRAHYEEIYAGYENL